MNRDVVYYKMAKDFHFLPGAREAVRELKEAGFLVIIVTNQRGVSLDLMSEEDLQEIHRKMREELGPGNVDAVYYCPHPKEADCDCRKPKPGMLLRGGKEFNVDLPFEKKDQK